MSPVTTSGGTERSRDRVWLERLETLAAYVDEHGQPTFEGTSGPGQWLNRQRQAARKGTLREDRRRLLDERVPGWDHDRDQQWMDHLEECARYVAEYGQTPPNGGSMVGAWLSNQRTAARSGKLQEARRRLLDERVPEWEHDRDQQWMDNLEDLAQYVADRGALPSKRAAGGLGRWLGDQRQEARAGTLQDDRRRALDERVPGWLPEVETPQQRAEKMIAAVLEHKEKHGELPKKHSSAAGDWLAYQRQASRSGDLRETLRRELDERVPGWDETPDFDARWEEKLFALRDYVQEHGRHPVMGGSSAAGIWRMNQVRLKRIGRLDPERRRRLDETAPGWDLSMRERRPVEQTLDELTAYIAEHGKTPPASVPRIGAWLHNQRSSARRGTLSMDRRRLLDKHVPGWLPEGNDRDRKWMGHLEDLARYVAEHGRTPPLATPVIGDWLNRQRQAARKGTLQKDRRRLLDERVPGWLPEQ
ncbi:helicase associated domain-containing protein [Brachybacterium sp. ACRRE]|uniref:helicase associated domain-containing protein n=1 Tax=Brachybacterium sp. ACRRE TaxID=2918184 RepID=UPI001EF2ED9E|nr:helicase associated domain-containing protein [Brachybacterium sp. ACRRE]MCG7308308.1 helicase associated domain-containing protein [Brachybacterium sp. ACRRE]